MTSFEIVRFHTCTKWPPVLTGPGTGVLFHAFMVCASSATKFEEYNLLLRSPEHVDGMVFLGLRLWRPSCRSFKHVFCAIATTDTDRRGCFLTLQCWQDFMGWRLSDAYMLMPFTTFDKMWDQQDALQQERTRYQHQHGTHDTIVPIQVSSTSCCASYVLELVSSSYTHLLMIPSLEELYLIDWNFILCVACLMWSGLDLFENKSKAD